MQSSLGAFVSARAQVAVVRVADPWVASDHVFTGFFISPHGHLVTSYHSVRDHVFDQPREFPLELHLPNAEQSRIDVSARWELHDERADWVLLTLDHHPPGYLPLADAGMLTGGPDDLAAPLRTYGFTTAQLGVAALGGISGEYLRAMPETGRFSVAFSIRSRGQSGGPVIDMRNQQVVGAVVAFSDDERLTGYAAVLDRSTFAGLDLGVDFADLAQRWRRAAIEYLCEANAELAALTSTNVVPSLPERYLANRDTARRIGAQLDERAPATAFLHGPPGSGKTSIAVEVVRKLQDAGRVDSVFWHDFAPRDSRSTAHLLQRLALYLFEQHGVVEPINACVEDTFVRDPEPAAQAVIDAIRRGRHLLVFDNFHELGREQLDDVTMLLSRVVRAGQTGQSVVLLASWDPAPPSIQAASYKIEGFNRQEVQAFLRLHEVTVLPEALDHVTDLADDITCVELFVRSPEWQSTIAGGAAGDTEPEALHSHWLNKYLAPVPLSYRHVLLALAVLSEPSTRPAIESTARVQAFASALAALQHSPPLVHQTEDRYHIHSNVARAVLSTSDSSLIRDLHRNAAGYLATQGEHLVAGQHLYDAGDAPDTVMLLFNRRDEIAASGGGRELQALAERLIRHPQRTDEWTAKLHAVVACSFNIRGEYARAAQRWLLAAQTLEAGGPLVALMHNRRGDTLRLASDYDAARDAYESAESAVRGLSGTQTLRELARSNLGLAKLDRLHSELSSARQRYQQAHDAFDALFDDLGLIEADFGIGEVSRLIEDWDTAEVAYSRSHRRAVETGNHERQAYGLWGLAEVDRLRDRTAEAEARHLAGLELCSRVGDTRSEGWAHLGLAETYRAAGRTDEALAAYDLALDRFEQTATATELAHARLGRAEALRAVGIVDLAVYGEISRTYAAKGLRHCELLCLRATAGALRGTERADQASALLHAAKQIALDCNLPGELGRIQATIDNPSVALAIKMNFP